MDMRMRTGRSKEGQLNRRKFILNRFKIFDFEIGQSKRKRVEATSVPPF